jgi:hypothetical protein
MVVTGEIQSIRSKTCPIAPSSTTGKQNITVVTAMCLECRYIRTKVHDVGHFVQKSTMTQTHTDSDFNHYSPGPYE